MADFSRRGVLLGSGLALGAAAAGSPRAAGPALAADGPSSKAVDLRTMGSPSPFLTLPSLAARSTMQDVVHEPQNSWLFITQAVNGANGSRSPYETTVVNRVRRSDGTVLDSMQLVDAGHGLGFEVEIQGGRPWIWTTWQGRSPDGDEYDFVRLRYAPGTWQRGAAADGLDLRKVAFQDRQDDSPEAVYHFDHAGGTAIERHFHFVAGGGAASETYYRRSIADLRSGSSRTRGAITLPATPPLVQGFATLGGAMFRLTGATAANDRVDPADPIRIEQYDWGTGRLVARRDFPSLAKDADGHWKDGICEPQGMSVFRESDGSASLLVGATTGDTNQREYHVLRFDGVGGA